MKRLLLLSLLCVAPTLAFAACEVTFITTLTQDGKPLGKTTNVWSGLDADGVKTLYDSGEKILKQLDKEDGKAKKGDGHELDFQRQTVCEGAASAPQEGARFEGLTWNAVTKVARAANKTELELLKMGDDHVAKGHKSGWKKS